MLLVTASALAAATGCDDDGQYINRTWKLFYRSCPTDDTASGAPSRYHARVQEIELILVAAGLIVSAAYIVAQSRSRGTTDHIAVRLLLGLIPAVVAVSIVLINRFDMVPDDLEQNLWLLSVVVVSGLLILGTGYRLARR